MSVLKKGICKAGCSRRQLRRVKSILETQHKVPSDRALEIIHGLSHVDCNDPPAALGLRGKANNEIRVALVRPLGSLAGDEEKQAVKEMGEPYQLELLAAVLVKAGYQVRIFDQLAGSFNPEHPTNYPEIESNQGFIDEISSWNPDVVGFGTFTYNFRKGLTIAAAVKEKTGAAIIFGGYHVVSVARQYLMFDDLLDIDPGYVNAFKQDLRNVFQHGIIDYACIGEGIKTILDILDVLKEAKDPREAAGIAFMEDGKIFINTPERLDLNDYQFPFRSNDFDHMKYYATLRDYPFLLMQTSSGCRYDCAYCSTPLNYPALSYRSIDSVIAELKLIAARFKHIWPTDKIMINLTDEDFASSPERVIELCKAIVANNLDKIFQFNSFFDNKSILSEDGDEMLEAMAAAGWEFCFIGIESLLHSALDGYIRPDRWSKDRVEYIQRAIDEMAAHRIMYFGDVMAGYPGHSLDDLRQDYDLLMELRRMYYVYLPILAPMPGTLLYQQVVLGDIGNGFLPGMTYDHFDANHQVVQLPGDGDVKAVRDEAIQHFFTRSSYVRDVRISVAQNQEAETFFESCFRSLSMDFPDNKKLAKNSRTLS